MGEPGPPGNLVIEGVEHTEPGEIMITKGLKGLKGRQGDRGYTGPKGPSGERGPWGDPGNAGYKGSKVSNNLDMSKTFVNNSYLYRVSKAWMVPEENKVGKGLQAPQVKRALKVPQDLKEEAVWMGSLENWENLDILVHLEDRDLKVLIISIILKS